MHEYRSYWDAFTVPLTNTLQRVVAFVPRMLVAVVLFLLFYGIAALSRHLTRRSLERLAHIPWAIRILVSRVVYLGVLIVGVLVALSAADINVATVIASLGLAGFALGFALKDILENFIAGILLLFARPFEVGDQVTLGAFEGTIRDIQIRTTSLETYHHEMVAIPNSDVYTNPVVNHTRLGKRRYQVDFDTSVTADLDTVRREALEAVHADPDIAAEPEATVRIIGVESANDILHWRVFFFAEPTKAIEIKTVSETLAGIKRRLYDLGVPTPTATSATLVKRAPPSAAVTGAAPAAATPSMPAGNNGNASPAGIGDASPPAGDGRVPSSTGAR